MSVEQLNFEDYPWKINIVREEMLMFKINSHLPVNGCIFCLDRNQAHLLMLYLQEYLKSNGEHSAPDAIRHM